jgi:hypothetical protein
LTNSNRYYRRVQVQNLMWVSFHIFLGVRKDPFFMPINKNKNKNKNGIIFIRTN